MYDETLSAISTFCLFLPGTLVSIYIFIFLFTVYLNHNLGPFLKLEIQDLSEQAIMINPSQGPSHLY